MYGSFLTTIHKGKFCVVELCREGKGVVRIPTMTAKSKISAYIKPLVIVSILVGYIHFYDTHYIPGFEKLDRVISLYDVTDMANLRRRLTQAEKLESIGRLAAGIAHEINTPTQYVLTNLHFLSEAFDDLIVTINSFGKLASEIPENVTAEIAPMYAEILEKADWEYLKEEIPSALKQSTEGMHLIQSIVTAMKYFSHPSGDVAEKCDLNKAIESTVTVARNEWKLIADVDLSLEPDLPSIPCFFGPDQSGCADHDC